MQISDLKAVLARGLAVMFVLSSAVMLGIAQSGTTAVSGSITDQQGNVVAGATVKLTSERGFSRSLVTTDNGTYNFPALQPGDYKVEVEATNFKKVVSSVRALVDTPATVNISLEAGNVSEVVNVTSGTVDALLNNQDASVGNTITGQQLANLPTQARNVLSLLSLQPGVTRDGSVAGNRSDQSNVTLDGVDINESQTNDISQPVLRLNSEAIEEFRVTTTTANATQGRSSGAQISVITKSGTNAWRGSAFLTGRRTGWTSNNFFNNRAGVGREALTRDTYGGSISGPIWKDKVFFLYSPEFYREKRGASVVRTVPLANLGQGVVRFTDTAGVLTSVNAADILAAFPAVGGVNDAARNVLAAAAAAYPANDFTVGDSLPTALKNVAGFRFNAPITDDRNSHIARFDFNINSKQQAFFRGNYIYDTSTTAPQFPDSPTPGVWNHPYGFVAGHTWTISNNLVNNFRFGLTRDAFSQQGDSDQNSISFRFIYSPRIFSRTLSRVTPVYNITDDVSWIKGNHTFQFGTNLRLISNNRTSYALAYDSAITNPSFYPQAALTDPINTYLTSQARANVRGADFSPVENALTAVIGGFSQFQLNVNYLNDGSQQGAGTPTERAFKTQEYDFYFQDIWKITPNVTITAGLRYGLSRPVYETSGYEIKSTKPLGQYFEERAAAAAAGQPFEELLTLDLSGPANGKTPLYKWDLNNFQPRVAIAWSPDFENGWLSKMFGKNKESVIRGGFGITNDYFGQSIAVRFDLNNRLGFSQSPATRANQYNLTTNLPPEFTGFNQSIRDANTALGGRGLVLPPSSLTYPRTAPFRAFPTAIESSLDEDLVAPIHYTWSATFERTLPGGLIMQASYLGRKARNLLQARDAAAITNFRDPLSGDDWYGAAGQLEMWRSQAIPVSQIPNLPYFQNVFGPNLQSLYDTDLDYICPGTYSQTQLVYALTVPFSLGGCRSLNRTTGVLSSINYGNDWTSPQLDLSLLSRNFEGKHIFYQPQYGTYGGWSTIGRADYNALTFSLRQRLGEKLTWDFNYTLSKAMDEGSGLQSAATTSGAGFILNPYRQDDMWALADFDSRHIINFNSVWQLPFGKGQWVAGDANKWLDAVVGGWQLSTIVRWNSGVPISAPYDDARWATNWNIQSFTTRIRPLDTCPDRGGLVAPKLFGCDPTYAYQSLRNALPGETGERNIWRLPSYWVADVGLGKSWTMPWHEDHKFQARWEVFNVANFQAMGAVDGSRTGYGVAQDPSRRNLAPPTNWSNFTGIQGDRRVMQYILRYSF